MGSGVGGAGVARLQAPKAARQIRSLGRIRVRRSDARSVARLGKRAAMRLVGAIGGDTAVSPRIK